MRSLTTFRDLILQTFLIFFFLYYFVGFSSLVSNKFDRFNFTIAEKVRHAATYWIYEQKMSI